MSTLYKITPDMSGWDERSARVAARLAATAAIEEHPDNQRAALYILLRIEGRPWVRGEFLHEARDRVAVDWGTLAAYAATGQSMLDTVSPARRALRLACALARRTVVNLGPMLAELPDHYAETIANAVVIASGAADRETIEPAQPRPSLLPTCGRCGHMYLVPRGVDPRTVVHDCEGMAS